MRTSKQQPRDADGFSFSVGLTGGGRADGRAGLGPAEELLMQMDEKRPTGVGIRVELLNNHLYCQRFLPAPVLGSPDQIARPCPAPVRPNCHANLSVPFPGFQVSTADYLSLDEPRGSRGAWVVLSYDLSCL